jgi:hypothetical protein
MASLSRKALITFKDGTSAEVEYTGLSSAFTNFIIFQMDDGSEYAVSLDATKSIELGAVNVEQRPEAG